MFGYLTADTGRMQKEERALYKAHYCGLCHILKEKYGKTGMAILSYDMTFLEMLLSDLSDSRTEEGMEKCVTHPVKAHRYIVSECTEYSADMQMLLAYYSAYDDANDGGSSQKAAKLEPFMKKLGSEYARQDEGVRKALLRIQEEERNGTKDPEFMARLSGEMISEIFVPIGTITFCGSAIADPSTVILFLTSGIPVLRYPARNATDVIFITRQPTSAGSFPAGIRRFVHACTSTFSAPCG